jgi:hypothetical protein
MKLEIITVNEIRQKYNYHVFSMGEGQVSQPGKGQVERGVVG